MKQYIDRLLHENPTQLISSIYAIIAGAATFLVTVKTSISDDSTWGQVALVVAAAALALLQGSTTKTEVFTGAEVDQISSEAHVEGQRTALAAIAQQRKEAAAKGAETRAAKTVAKPAKRTARR